MNIESIKDAGNDLDMEVLLWVTLLCIVSNNSHTKIGKIWNITKYFLVYFFFCIILIFKALIVQCVPIDACLS